MTRLVKNNRILLRNHSVTHIFVTIQLHIKYFIMKNSIIINETTLQMERIMDAPLALVWQVWSDANLIAKWWAPEGMELKTENFDFKVGGKWTYSMPMPDGSQFVSKGSYLDIVPQQKIVTSADFKPMTEDVELHIKLSSEGSGTRFIFEVVHKTAEYCQQQLEKGFDKGWGAAFDRMENLISQMQISKS